MSDKKIRLRNIKHQFLFQVSGLPDMNCDGGKFRPQRIVVTEYIIPTQGEPRAKVEVAGTSLTGRMGEGRSKPYNMYGYPQYEPVEKWLIKLLEKAGYSNRMELE